MILITIYSLLQTLHTIHCYISLFPHNKNKYILSCYYLSFFPLYKKECIIISYYY